jgi:hypothetical protein
MKFGSDSSDNDDDSYEGYDDVEPIDEAIKIDFQRNGITSKEIQGSPSELKIIAKMTKIESYRVKDTYKRKFTLSGANSGMTGMMKNKS